MRARTALAAGLSGLLTVCAAVPSVAATRKPKPIRGTYQAQATPDPTTTSEVTGTCNPVTPTGKHEKAFTVPARGYLHVELQNTLDWALAVLTEDGEVLSEQDGGLPNDKEMTDVSFRRKTKVLLRACNFAGEPQVTVNYVFTYR